MKEGLPTLLIHLLSRMASISDHVRLIVTQRTILSALFLHWLRTGYAASVHHSTSSFCRRSAPAHFNSFYSGQRLTQYFTESLDQSHDRKGSRDARRTHSFVAAWLEKGRLKANTSQLLGRLLNTVGEAFLIFISTPMD